MSFGMFVYFYCVFFICLLVLIDLMYICIFHFCFFLCFHMTVKGKLISTRNIKAIIFFLFLFLTKNLIHFLLSQSYENDDIFFLDFIIVRKRNIPQEAHACFPYHTLFTLKSLLGYQRSTLHWWVYTNRFCFAVCIRYDIKTTEIKRTKDSLCHDRWC